MFHVFLASHKKWRTSEICVRYNLGNYNLNHIKITKIYQYNFSLTVCSFNRTQWTKLFSIFFLSHKVLLESDTITLKQLKTTQRSFHELWKCVCSTKDLRQLIFGLPPTVCTLNINLTSQFEWGSDLTTIYWKPYQSLVLSAVQQVSEWDRYF